MQFGFAVIPVEQTEDFYYRSPDDCALQYDTFSFGADLQTFLGLPYQMLVYKFNFAVIIHSLGRYYQESVEGYLRL